MENWCRSKKPLRINVKSSALNFKWKVNSNLKNTTKNRHLLCWILLYCSWRISEITSAVPCKAVMRNSLTYTRSVWRTPCTKAALVLAHDVKGMLHWSQLCQGQEHTTEVFPASYAQIPSIWDGLYGSGTPTHILCKSPAEISWVPTPCSPSPAPSPPGAAFSKVCPSLCPLQPLCPISYSSCLHFQWYQVASLPISPGHVMFPDVSRPLHLS